MKINDRKELHTKSVEELQKLLKEAYTTLSEVKLDHVQNKLKNTRIIFTGRKEIAVIKTLITEKLRTKEESK